MQEELKVNSPDPNTNQCALCEKFIDSSKFKIHEIMCHKINYRCSKCGELVPKQDREEHDQEVCGK